MEIVGVEEFRVSGFWFQDSGSGFEEFEEFRVKFALSHSAMSSFISFHVDLKKKSLRLGGGGDISKVMRNGEW
jgi:hypothetical protein